MLLKKKISVVLAAAMVVTSLFGCSPKKSADTNMSGVNVRPTAADVKKDGKLVTYGMPDNWANYKDIYKGFTAKYGIPCADTDMSSAEEISKFLAEKNNPVADLGDIGQSYGSTAIAQKVVQPYKNQHWDDVPSWAKDPNGNWCGAYTGTICFMVNKKLVKDTPKTWKDLLKPEYKNMVVVGNVQQQAQAQIAFLAATYANGGDETNLQPGIDYFKKLKAAGNIRVVDDTIANLQKNELPIAIYFDFNALSDQKLLKGQLDFDIVIPQDGTTSVAYVSVINAKAPHLAAAKAFQDFIFSDEGQIDFAKGFARPIRSNVKLPDDVKAQLIPDEEYKSVKNIKDFSAWEKSSKELPDLWRNNILG